MKVDSGSRGYIYLASIDDVDDVFDPIQVWQQASPFLRKPRLLRALDRHKVRMGESGQGAVFSHIELLLAADEVEHDRRIARGKRAEALCRGLEKLHQQAFGEDPNVNGAARYRVVGAPELPTNRIVARFGHAIYVPEDAGSRKAFLLEGTPDGLIWEPVAFIHADQRLALLGHADGRSACVPAGWPFGADQAVVLIHELDNGTVDLGAEPCNSLSISTGQAQGCHLIEHGGAQYQLRITTIAPEPSREVTNRQPERSRSNEESLKPDVVPAEGTFMPNATEATGEGTYVPLNRAASLSLVGLAMQRISAFGRHGIEGLHIGFDAQLHVLPSPKNADWALSLCVEAGNGEDLVSVLTRQGRRQIRIPERMTLLGKRVLAVDLLPDELADRYLGWCGLPEALVEPLGHGVRLTLGRDQRAFAGLRVLSGAGCLLGADDQSGDRMGLSRKAFSVELCGDALEVKVQSPSQTLFQLDAEMCFVARLDGLGASCSLQNGQHLVVGHYVLRYGN